MRREAAWRSWSPEALAMSLWFGRRAGIGLPANDNYQPHLHLVRLEPKMKEEESPREPT